MAFPIHNVIEVDEPMIQPLNAFDQAACDRVLQLFATPYSELTKAQIDIMERIVAETKIGQIPFQHVFQPHNVLFDDSMDDIPLMNAPRHVVEPLPVPLIINLAPYIKTIKLQNDTGHTMQGSIADQMRSIWKSYFDATGYDEDHIYTQNDVLDFVQYLNIIVDDPNLGVPFVTAGGGQFHVKYDETRECFMQRFFSLCLAPGCFRFESSVMNDEFPNCCRHYDVVVHAVFEISRPNTNHPCRHVQFQVTIDEEWNGSKRKEYYSKIWNEHKRAYHSGVPSSITQSWIFTTYQQAVDKIACLQFCHMIKALNDHKYEYDSDQITLPINLQDRIGPILEDLGISITLNGLVSEEELESIGLADLFGEPFSEALLQQSKIVLYRAANDHLEYRGLCTDWTKKKMATTDTSNTLLFACIDRGQKLKHEPRRILMDKDGMEKAEFFTIFGSAIMAYLHAPRPDTRQDFVNVNVRANARFVREPRDPIHVPIETYQNSDEHYNDYSYDDEGGFYDAEHLSDLELLLQWIANEYRVKVVITVVEEEEDLVALGLEVE